MRSSKTRETIICTLEAQANLSSQDSGIMKPFFKIHRPAHGNVPLMDIEIFVLKTPPTFFYFEFSLTYQGTPHLCWKKNSAISFDSLKVDKRQVDVRETGVGKFQEVKSSPHGWTLLLFLSIKGLVSSEISFKIEFLLHPSNFP